MKLLQRMNLFLFALLLAAAPAHQAAAAIFCVATGDQLTAALLTASQNDENDSIKIEYGTLLSSGWPQKDYQWLYDGRFDDYATAISGGWSKGNSCASIATNSPDATILDAQWAGPVFVADLQHTFHGVLTISNLTFARGHVYNATECHGYYYQIPCATGLAVEAWGSGSVVIDNVLITSGRVDAGVTAPIASLWSQDSGTLRLRNSIVMGNTLGTGVGTTFTRGVDITTRNNSTAFVSNNSIFGNIVTTREVGLIVDGVATLSNNAVAENTSTGATAYQFTAKNVGLQTWWNNHFSNYRVDGGGFPFSNIATTLGDAQWTQSGVRMVPNAESVLRDSGDNTPTGGIPSVDFSGNARIINGVIDRGAVEAAAVLPIGPSVTPSSPSSGSTTTVYGVDGASVDRVITFSVSGGNLGGTTELLCDGLSGAAQVTNGNQTISTGSSVVPVTVTLPVTSSPATHSVWCSATRSNGPVSTYFFYYRIAPDLILSDGFETGP